MREKKQSRLMQSEAGQAMVEFSLTITLTLLLIFGMIDFSRAVYTASIIQWAAQNGARAAIVERSRADVPDAVEIAVKERLVGLDKALVEIPTPTWDGNVVTVTVIYPFDFIAPIIERITGDAIELRSSASMVAH